MAKKTLSPDAMTKIAAIATEEGWTQQEVGDLLGTYQQKVSKLLKQYEPPLVELVEKEFDSVETRTVRTGNTVTTNSHTVSTEKRMEKVEIRTPNGGGRQVFPRHLSRELPSHHQLIKGAVTRPYWLHSELCRHTLTKRRSRAHLHEV